MAVMPIRKAVGAPGAAAAPNELVAVRVGAGFDLHMADSDGSALVPLNQPGGIPEGAMLVIGASDDIPAGWYPVSTFTAGAVELRVISRTPPQRVTVPETASLGFSAHSFLATAVGPDHGGDLHSFWTGATFMNFEGFSSLESRWNENDIDRTGAYSGALIVTEIGDLVTGLADPASEAGISTLQHLYWFALTAQAKGCALFGIFPPWSPEGMDADADTTAKCQYWVDWMRARPEITIPVFMLPVPQIVRAMIAYYAPASIYVDGLHLRDHTSGGPAQCARALSRLTEMFLTGVKSTRTLDNGELSDLIDIGWDLLTGPTGHAFAGFGGGVVTEPFPVAADPLPSPAPLP